MLFKLPKLNTLVSNSKKLEEDDQRQFIHVINGYGIVSNEIVAVVDLREYVKSQCKISEDDQLETLKEILDFMEGKSFTKDFWSELIVENFVRLNGQGNLNIENQNYNKILVYDHIETDTLQAFTFITDNIDREGKSVQRIAFDGKIIDSLNKAFKSELSNDSLLIEFTGQQNSAKFQLTKKDYIFGLLPTNYNSANEITSFLQNELFKKTLLSSI
jgi:hypothetical protein